MQVSGCFLLEEDLARPHIGLFRGSHFCHFPQATCTRTVSSNSDTAPSAPLYTGRLPPPSSAHTRALSVKQQPGRLVRPTLGTRPPVHLGLNKEDHPLWEITGWVVGPTVRTRTLRSQPCCVRRHLFCTWGSPVPRHECCVAAALGRRRRSGGRAGLVGPHGVTSSQLGSMGTGALC